MVSKVKRRAQRYDAVTVHMLKKLWNHETLPKLTTVRRNLFGLYERKNASQLLDEQVTDMAKKSQQEWNFDFLNELPQTGKYVWQKVSSCDVPLWYTTVRRPTLKDPCKVRPCVLKETEIECNLSQHVEDGTERPPRKKKPRLVQTSIKDYTRVQKRRTSCRLRLKQLQLYYRSRQRRNHDHNVA